MEFALYLEVRFLRTATSESWGSFLT